MEIDLERLKLEGQVYVDSVIQEIKREAWDNLRAAKFAGSSVDEVEIMQTIWSHGFMRGAEAATRLMMKLSEESKKQVPLLWTPTQKKKK
jgi:hypothetical protein